jgi:hypothetical protein
MNKHPLPWTLKLKSWQLFLLFILFHPLYGLWVYQMGTYCAAGTGKKAILFRITSGYILLVYLFLQLPIISYLATGHTHLGEMLKNEQGFVSGLILSWWLCLAVSVIKAANYVLAYQNRNNTYSTTYTLGNIITWSMLIGYWILGIWFMQAMMNDLEEEDEK